MTFVDLRRRQCRKQVHVDNVDLRRAFDTICGVAVSGYVKRLICILRVVEVVRDGKLVRLVKIPISFAEERVVLDRVFYGKPFFLTSGCSYEVDDRQTLTIRIGVYEGLIGPNCWSRDRAGSGSNLSTQIG